MDAATEERFRKIAEDRKVKLAVDQRNRTDLGERTDWAEVRRIGDLHSKWRCQQSKWQGDRQEDDFQNSVDGDADDSEREQEQPHEGIGDQSQQR
jgi:hypothetical protein